MAGSGVKPSSDSALRDASSDSARARISSVASKALLAEAAESEADASEALGQMRTIGARGGVWQITSAWPWSRQFDPREFYEEPSGGGRVLGNVPNALPATGPHEAATRAGRRQLPHNPLMAGRRRRTAAAALRWRRCRCRCRSSSRSTCAEIKVQATRRRHPDDCVCSMAWRFTTALMLRIT